MTEPLTEQDWREVPRSEMLDRVMAAVDAGALEVMEKDGVDAWYVRYCDEQLFPFLEDEKRKAQEEEE
jgi:hypothetical protein